jgi:DNA-binding GntR family transcriptional regulator
MPVPAQREPVERHLLRETAYAALRDAIVAGTLAPGEQLHDDELCGWLGLSRTPVRDALTRLRDEGLVEISPQRSTRVTPCARRDARDLFPLLAAIHALATQLAVGRLTRLDLAQLQLENEAFIGALRRGDAAAAHAADDRFHGVFVTAADNREITRTLERLSPALHRLEVLHTGRPPGRRSVAHHQAIIDRAAVGDADRAASAVRENWLTLGALIEHSMAE